MSSSDSSGSPSLTSSPAPLIPSQSPLSPPINANNNTQINFFSRLNLYKMLIFALTFLSYAVYSGTRQPFGITKSALHPDKTNSTSPGFAPFNSDEYGSLYLGISDTTFLSFYAIGLFISGPLGDRLNLRLFLGFGMIASGFFCVLFGLAAAWSIHSLVWFVFCNVGAGLAQSTGWPGNVTLMTRWYGQGKRGTIMGFWNAHGSIGNICGKLLATYWMNTFGWQYAFIGMGGVCAGAGGVMLAGVVPHPEEVLNEAELAQLHSTPNNQSINQGKKLNHDDFPSISFWTALKVPGVIAYSICLFFSKLVAYAFIFWLPYYLTSLDYSDAAAGNISTVYDMGGVAGGIIAGYLSDISQKRGLVSFVMLLLCLPGLFFYQMLASYGTAINIILMFVVGILVNGPYTLISSAVAADLGSHPILNGNPKAMSTVTGIIDGTGSVGSALQGVLIGVVGHQLGWTNVFYMLMTFCLFSAACLFRIVRHEVGPVKSWRWFRDRYVETRSRRESEELPPREVSKRTRNDVVHDHEQALLDDADEHEQKKNKVPVSNAQAPTTFTKPLSP